jgi:hypothetical protein
MIQKKTMMCGDVEKQMIGIFGSAALTTCALREGEMLIYWAKK